MKQLYGIIPPVLTPFNADESPDVGAFRAIMSFQIEKGVHGLFPLGSAGDGLLLTKEERKHLARVAVDEARGRVPVMIHAGALITAECVELALDAREIGADAISVLPPFYYRFDEDAIFGHITAVAQAVPDFPVYVYNNPITTGNPLSAALVQRIVAACPNVVGVKDSSDVLAQAQDYVRMLGPDFTVLTGSNTIPVASFVVGCKGVISSMANAFPEVVVAMWDAFVRGDVPCALEYQNLLLAPRAVMLKNGGVPTGLKTVLQARGLPIGGVRRPVRAPRSEESAAVTKVCRDLGLITPIN